MLRCASWIGRAQSESSAIALLPARSLSFSTIARLGHREELKAVEGLLLTLEIALSAGRSLSS